jgi:hypothetical protein
MVSLYPPRCECWYCLFIALPTGAPSDNCTTRGSETALNPLLTT